MGQIKNIKLHIVTDIKGTGQRNTSNKDGSQQSLVLTSSQLWTWFQKVSCLLQSTRNNSQIWTQFVQTVLPRICQRYRLELEKDVKDILKQEETDKALRIADMHVNKAQNMIVHRDEIMSRPARTFIKSSNKKEGEKKKTKESNKKKLYSEADEEQRKIFHQQEFQIRQMKRERKPKRIRACEEDDEKPRKGGSKKSKLVASGNSFSRALTDTSRKNVKNMRGKPDAAAPKKKGGGFKTKGRHKRR